MPEKLQTPWPQSLSGAEVAHCQPQVKCQGGDRAGSTRRQGQTTGQGGDESRKLTRLAPELLTLWISLGCILQGHVASFLKVEGNVPIRVFQQAISGTSPENSLCTHPFRVAWVVPSDPSGGPYLIFLGQQVSHSSRPPTDLSLGPQVPSPNFCIWRSNLRSSQE